MNDSELDALFARARARRPDTSRQEYLFETRLMARLREQRQATSDTGSIWAMVSWRMIPIFAACLMVLAVVQTHLVAVTDESMALNHMEHPETADLFDSLN